MLLTYETLIKYDLSEQHLRCYGETRLTIYHSSDHLAQLSSSTNIDDWTNFRRLTTWIPHQDDIILCL